jgi:transcriptional regulator with XRE-family HTH domain
MRIWLFSHIRLERYGYHKPNVSLLSNKISNKMRNRGFKMSLVANRLKARRKQLNLTQEDVAVRSQLAQTQISRYELGKNQPTAEVIAILARALETSSDWLLGLTDEVNTMTAETELDEQERQLLGLYRTKSREAREAIINLARMLS